MAIPNPAIPRADKLMPELQKTPKISEEAKKAMAFADAALNLAGHQVTDPVLQNLRREHAAGLVSVEEALAIARNYVQR